MKRILILFLWVCVSFAAQSQSDCSFTHYAAGNGLSQHTVMSIIQDQKGFMWFASWGGLHKFDGYNFKIYKSDPNNDVGLSHDRIDYISEDKYGYLWLLTYDDKAHRFDPSTETFLTFPVAEEEQPINITTVKVLPNGVVWLLTDRQGVIRVTTDSVHHTVKTVYYSASSDFMPAHIVNHVFLDRNGNEWVLGKNGLGLFRHYSLLDSECCTQQDAMQTHRSDPRSSADMPEMFFAEKESSLDNIQQFYTACETDDEIYFGSDNGRVWRYQKGLDHFVLLQLPVTSHIVAVHEVDRQELFIATATDGFFLVRSNAGVRADAGVRTNADVHADADAHADAGVRADADAGVRADVHADTNVRTNADVRAGVGVCTDTGIPTDANQWMEVGSGIDMLSFMHYAPEQYPALTDMPVLSVYKDRFSEMWFEQAIMGEVLHFNSFTRKLKRERLFVEPAPAHRALPAFHIHEDIHGYTWVHPYGGGFSFFDRQQNKLIPFYNDPQSGDWRFSNKIHAAYSDEQGNLWMCTHSKGLEKITFQDAWFKLQAVTDVSTHESLANEVRAFCEDAEHNLWVGLKDGHLRVYDKDGRYKGYLCSDGRIATHGRPIDGVVYAIMQDNTGNIWLGTKGEGLICVEKRNDVSDLYTLIRYKFQANQLYSLSDNNVYSIHQDYNGRIWIATFGGGINYVERGTDGTVRFINHRNNLKNYPIDRCYRTRFITSDEAGRIWVGTTVGLLLFDADFKNPDDVAFEHYIHREGVSGSLSNNDVHWITVTEDKDVYLATFGGGLNRFVSSFDPDTPSSFRSYTKDDGLLSDILLSMQEDKDGNLWICTESGISKFYTSEDLFENYDQKHLHVKTRFNEAAVVKRHDNRFLFGTSDGILSFFPDSIHKRNDVPQIAFTRLHVKGEPVVPGDAAVIRNVIDDVPELVLSHRNNIFSLHYSALEMANPENIKYAYILEGFEENWSYVEGQRVATYTNLPKGHYLLKVKSTNGDGVWVDNVRMLPITILPSFWETPFAYFLYVLAVALFIIAAVYILFTIFRLKHEVTVEQQITDIKLRFFTDISHELRTPLTLINGPVEYVLEEKKLPDDVREQLRTVQRNSDRMLHLVNQILDFRKVQNKRMKLLISYVDVVAQIRKTMKNFEQLAKENRIDFIFETESESVSLWIDADKFDKILFNLLSNAFKYTKNGKMIKVFLLNEEKHCVVGVQDQGIGIAEHKKDSVFIRFENIVDRNLFDFNSTGIGLSLVKELAEMQHASIHLESVLGEGSTFTVEFQKGRAHYDKSVEYLLTDVETHDQLEKPEKDPIEEPGGEPLGEADGKALGEADGKALGEFDGKALGEFAEESLGESGGEPLGEFDGKALGEFAEDSLGEADGEALGESDGEAAGKAVLEKELMLLIEDNAELRYFLKTIFSDTFHVIEAANGEEGLTKAIQSIPDIVVSDIMMSGKDGFEVTKELRANFDTSHIPIVLLTARSTMEDKLAGLEYGADDYITKPFSSTYLKARVENLLAQRRKLQELYYASLMAHHSDEEDVAPNKATVHQEIETPVISPKDQRFMDRLVELMEQNMDNSELVVEDLAKELAMSRSVFFKKLKALTGLAPIEFIRELRIKRAAELIRTDEYTITQVSDRVGINDSRYFSKCFKRVYGMTPTAYREQYLQKNK